jgi:nitrate/nitrite-specific signal transduction histidine kinase
VEPDRVTIFIRDRGRGFDPNSVPVGRMGIRQSIIGRMRRPCHRARGAGAGTEVEVQLTRE